LLDPPQVLVDHPFAHPPLRLPLPERALPLFYLPPVMRQQFANPPQREAERGFRSRETDGG
jgi:hypothetical protein